MKFLVAALYGKCHDSAIANPFTLLQGKIIMAYVSHDQYRLLGKFVLVAKSIVNQLSFGEN